MRALLQDDAAQPRNPMEAEEALRFTQLLLDRAGEGGVLDRSRRPVPLRQRGGLLDAGVQPRGAARAQRSEYPAAGAAQPLPGALGQSPRPGSAHFRGDPRAQGGRALPGRGDAQPPRVQGAGVLLRLRPRRHRAQAGRGRPARLGGALPRPVRGGAGGALPHHSGGADARRQLGAGAHPWLSPTSRLCWRPRSATSISTRRTAAAGSGPSRAPARCRASRPRVRRRRDGAVIWVRFTVRAVRGAQGEVLHYEGALEDVTDRRHAEEALRASEERFRSLVQNASDLISILSADGTVRYESPSHQRVLGPRAGGARRAEPARPRPSGGPRGRSPRRCARSSRSRTRS